MKKEVKKVIHLKKLTIARIDANAMHQIRGGDCLPTEPTWFEHGQSDYYCPTSELP